MYEIMKKILIIKHKFNKPPLSSLKHDVKSQYQSRLGHDPLGDDQEDAVRSKP